MRTVLTPDGWGQVLRSESARGKTSYLVKGAGFEGWYDGLQVSADFADDVEDVVPNEDNETVLPYPSRAQGPGWDGTTSTIPPDVDIDIEHDHASDSLTGDSTDEDPVDADIEGLFEAPSRLAATRGRHRLHFAAGDDPILDVSAIPDESPTGLEESPINPDSVDTDDLFDGSLPHFERASSHDRLVIEDELSFMRYAADDDGDGEKDDDKKEQGTDPSDFFGDDDSDDDDSDDGDDSDSDDDGGDSDSDSSDGDSGGDGDGGGDGGGGGHTASFALSTTTDLHFLANFCNCASEDIPLHSKVEHRELVAEGKLQDKRKGPLGSKPLTGHYGDKSPKTPAEAGYTTPKNKGVGKTIKKNKKPRQDGGQFGRKPKKKVERPISYTADFDTPAGRGTPNNVTPQDADLDGLLERYQQDNFNYQERNLDDLVDRSEDDGDGAANLNNYASVEERFLNALNTYGIQALAAPAEVPAPTQIESQIEQLMQFWATDSNGWWHWTGSQADLALLNQMQQQMAAVGQPAGQPGQMQTQGFVIEANTPAPWREYLEVIASNKLVALAAWKDVVQKSKRLRSEGAIDLEVFKPEVITAYVQGDNGRYYTTVQRLGSVGPGIGRQLASTQVSGWSCECEWGHWAWIRKRSFVGRMCSHAYALFSEMRSLDAKRRRGEGRGRPIGGGQSLASVSNKTAWTRTEQGGFEWVSDDPAAPTAVITRTASGWKANVWSDGTADDSLSLGSFEHSEQARRAVSRAVLAHLVTAEMGDVDLVSPETTPDITGGYPVDPYAEDGLQPPQQEGSTGVQESQGRYGSFSLFAADDGQDEEGPESDDDGIEEESDPRDEESLDEEIAQDEGDSDDGAEDEGEAPDTTEDDDDGGHYEPHKRDDSEDDDEGTDNPGDESDDDGIEKESSSSVAELQSKFGLSHLAGANYSLAQQDKLVREGDGKIARNLGDLNLTGTHYEAAAASSSAEDVLAFLF